MHATLAFDRGERANALTAWLGLALALAGACWMLPLAILRGNAWQWASALAFSFALVLMHLASSLYHSASVPARKARLKVLDHCAIYLLIAGTYTPFTLVALRGEPGWILFAAVWTLAAVGVVFKLFSTGRFRLFSTLVYVAMGWLVLFAIKPVWAALDAWTLGWLFAGGVAYTLGTLFYLRRSWPHSHAVWHLFVIAGGACHFIAIAAQVLPRA
ncbi:hemolysin III family protein [Pseudoluteimonas lycopersici]|uniref:Hemolysin III family protein n=1 Tax=Pseudoluteimonas lycopersici TaxID=1324796 RepID=A0A516V4U0_9GAMM|nr:hemolysin III family protein [Lysobacter lycopersici]QDQ73556.1 hemolysin III family protein [Lysobacter lycopersici]